MRVTTLLVGSILLFILLVVVGSSAGRTTRTPNASRPLSAADVEHGLKAAVPNARMAALVKQYGVDFELTNSLEKELRSAGANDSLILQIGHSRAHVGRSPKEKSTGYTVAAHGRQLEKPSRA